MMDLHIYENGLTSWTSALTAELDRALAELGVERGQMRVHRGGPAGGSSRSLVLYFSSGRDEADQTTRRELEMHLAAGRPIIPVLDSASDATAKLPELLRLHNAFVQQKHRHWEPALVDEILSQIWLARPHRKLFISYRRADSRAIAGQLHTLFVDLGYEVFLDDCSIGAGRDFQRELAWCLNDTDFVLLLASPGIASSRWVLDEIEFATHASIGFLALCWPGARAAAGAPGPLSALDDDQWIDLAAGDICGVGPAGEQTLEPAVAARIETEVQRKRTRFIVERLRSLLPSVRDALAPEYAVKDGELFGDLRAQHLHRKMTLHLRVTPFRPTLDTIYALRTYLQQCSDPEVSRAGCVYRENDTQDLRFLGLEWATLVDRADEIPGRYHLLTLPLDRGKLP